MKALLVGGILMLASATAWLVLGKPSRAVVATHALGAATTTADAPAALPPGAVETSPVPSVSAAHPARSARDERDRANQTSTSVDERRKRYRATLARHMASGSHDVSRTRQTRSTVDTLLARPEFTGSRVEEASCTTTLCRIEVTHGTEGALHEFLGHALELSVGGPGVGYRDYDVEGQFRTVIVFGNSGEALPEP